MRYQLVEYRGVGPAQREVVVGESANIYALYSERDKLDVGSVSLTARRHGVRPVFERGRPAAV